MRNLFSRKTFYSWGVGALLGVFAASSAAQASVDTSQCTTAESAQQFLYANDNNWYVPVPGEGHDNFAADGWTLSGGARIVAEKLLDGTEGQVLDLPSGSKAVSPVVCVTSQSPTARAVVRNVKGAEGVYFYVEYEGTNTWNKPKNTGQIHGDHTDWTTVTPVNMQPENTPRLQPMRITLVPGGTTSDFEVYNLYIDPHIH